MTDVASTPSTTPAGLARLARWLRGAAWLVRETFDAYLRDDIPRLGAALAYYSVFSIGPLLLIVISFVGFLFGPDASQGRILQSLDAVFGTRGAEVIETIVANANRPRAGLVASAIGLVMFGLAATGVFVELKHALNVVWAATDKGARGVRGFVRDRALSFAMMLVIGFLSMVSLVASAIVTAASGLLLLGNEAAWLVRGTDFLVSLTIFTALIAAIFKLLPDTRIAWRDVWLGATVTTLLFLVGRLALGATLGHTTSMDVYGAASSLVLLLAWTYYCAQIFLIGAALTYAFAQRYGSRKNAAVSEGEARPPRAHAPQE